MKIPKTNAAIVGSMVIGIALGSGTTYALLRYNEYKTPQALITNTDTSTKENTLPDGSLSPNTVAQEINKYAGKELTLRGKVVESAPGQYSIVGEKPEERFGVKLDFAKSKLDPKKYIITTAKEADKTVKIVTIKGTLTETKTADGNFLYALSVTSVTE